MSVIRNQFIANRLTAELNRTLKPAKLEIKFIGDADSEFDMGVMTNKINQFKKQIELQDSCSHRFVEKVKPDDIEYCRYCYLCR